MPIALASVLRAASLKINLAATRFSTCTGLNYSVSAIVEMLSQVYQCLALLRLAQLIGIGGPAAAEQIRGPCSQPGFAEQLKITGPLADDVAAASAPQPLRASRATDLS